MTDRRSYLVNQQAMGLLTDAERDELASTPDIRYTPDGKPAMVFPPPLQGNTHEEKLADFARRYMFEDREATPDEVAAFVNGGKPIAASHDHQAPVDERDEWADDADPGTPPPAVVPVVDPLPASAPVAPVGNATVTDDEMIEVRDPSYPHDPPKLIRRSLWEKQQRKQRINSAQARAGRTIGRG